MPNAYRLLVGITHVGGKLLSETHANAEDELCNIQYTNIQTYMQVGLTDQPRGGKVESASVRRKGWTDRNGVAVRYVCPFSIVHLLRGMPTKDGHDKMHSHLQVTLRKKDDHLFFLFYTLEVVCCPVLVISYPTIPITNTTITYVVRYATTWPEYSTSQHRLPGSLIEIYLMSCTPDAGADITRPVGFGESLGSYTCCRVRLVPVEKTRQEERPSRLSDLSMIYYILHIARALQDQPAFRLPQTRFDALLLR
ncbi:hypothetical protein GGR51DRAFT_433305 [Nemania sp. FL0031]|nr:hypothetical protein GGR51DRAFT_433305 [Nemania sp. FL0031]